MRGHTRGLHSTLFWGERRGEGRDTLSDQKTLNPGAEEVALTPGHPTAGHPCGRAAAARAAHPHITCPRHTEHSSRANTGLGSSLTRSPPTFPRPPSHHPEPKEAVVPAAGRRSTTGEPSSAQVVRHRTPRVPPAVALLVFAVRHGRSPACARLRTALLCVRVALRHSQTSRPAERG